MESQGRIEALTGLRFLAAFSILFSHAFDWLFHFSDSDVSRNFSVLSVYGMPLFFVLSGFVIHYNYGSLFARERYGSACWQFGVARFARLYPLFVVLLLFSCAADSFFTNNANLVVRILARYLTLTQTWKYTVYDHRMLPNWIFGLSWSVSTEWFFYLAYALLIFRVRALGSVKTALAATVGFVVLVFSLSVWGSDHRGLFILPADGNLGTPDLFNNSFYRWALYFSPYARLPEFILGCLVAQLYLALKEKPGPVEQRAGQIAGLLSLVFLGWAGWAWVSMGPDHPHVTNYVSFMSLNFGVAPGLALMIFCCARYRIFAGVVDAPIMLALGERSYSIYLIQPWTLNILNKATPEHLTASSAADALLRVILGILATLVVADATYRLIEVPARRWLRKRFQRVAPRTVGQATSPTPVASALRMT
ncbi:MAG TPA: acyltransferase [Terracidiphilus sp.]|jgi:peptidoglycan/LPS O-acetylase OafA/YrhL